MKRVFAVLSAAAQQPPGQGGRGGGAQAAFSKRASADPAMLERGKHQGDNVPWGQGETPIREVLLMLQKERWPIPAYIEYEYRGAGTPIEEDQKCFQFAKQILG